MAASDTVPETDIATLLQQQNASLQQVVTVLTRIACALEKGADDQQPPARSAHHAQAPQRRVTA